MSPQPRYPSYRSSTGTRPGPGEKLNSSSVPGDSGDRQASNFGSGPPHTFGTRLPVRSHPPGTQLSFAQDSARPLQTPSGPMSGFTPSYPSLPRPVSFDPCYGVVGGPVPSQKGFQTHAGTQSSQGSFTATAPMSTQMQPPGQPPPNSHTTPASWTNASPYIDLQTLSLGNQSYALPRITQVSLQSGPSSYALPLPTAGPYPQPTLSQTAHRDTSFAQGPNKSYGSYGTSAAPARSSYQGSIGYPQPPPTPSTNRRHGHRGPSVASPGRHYPPDNRTAMTTAFQQPSAVQLAVRPQPSQSKRHSTWSVTERGDIEVTPASFHYNSAYDLMASFAAASEGALSGWLYRTEDPERISRRLELWLSAQADNKRHLLRQLNWYSVQKDPAAHGGLLMQKDDGASYKLTLHAGDDRITARLGPSKHNTSEPASQSFQGAPSISLVFKGHGPYVDLDTAMRIASSEVFIRSYGLAYRGSAFDTRREDKFKPAPPAQGQSVRDRLRRLPQRSGAHQPLIWRVSLSKDLEAIRQQDDKSSLHMRTFDLSQARVSTEKMLGCLTFLASNVLSASRHDRPDTFITERLNDWTADPTVMPDADPKRHRWRACDLLQFEQASEATPADIHERSEKSDALIDRKVMLERYHSDATLTATLETRGNDALLRIRRTPYVAWWNTHRSKESGRDGLFQEFVAHLKDAREAREMFTIFQQEQERDRDLTITEPPRACSIKESQAACFDDRLVIVSG